MATILANSLENRKLAELRDALLPKLMSGEIDVSQVELSTQPNNHLLWTGLRVWPTSKVQPAALTDSTRTPGLMLVEYFMVGTSCECSKPDDTYDQVQHVLSLDDAAI